MRGAHSQLGPIEPQFTISTPEGASQRVGSSHQGPVRARARAMQGPEQPPRLDADLALLRAGLLAPCDHAAERARAIVRKALEEHMFAGLGRPHGESRRSRRVVRQRQGVPVAWSPPVRRGDAREHGIEIQDLEDDSELQDLVLISRIKRFIAATPTACAPTIPDRRDVHHAAMHTLAGTPTAKLIENHHGRAWILIQGQVQIALQAPGIAAPAPALP